MSLRDGIRSLVTDKDHYNGWGIEKEVAPHRFELCKRHLLAKNKRGHDDEVDRELVFPSRTKAKLAMDEIAKKHPKLNLRVCKVWVDAVVVSDAATKDLEL